MLILSASCQENIASLHPQGSYVESDPVNGRSQLNFIDDHLVIKGKAGSTIEDTFNYQIKDGMILLTLLRSQLSTPFEFTAIDNNTFRIGNLYPSIPEALPILMTFKK
jgi:hypothetical protein